MAHILNFKDWYKVYESNGFKFDSTLAIFEGAKDDLRTIVASIMEKEDPSVKSHPEYAHMMAWFQNAGNPPGRSKDAKEVIPTPEDMYQSMVYWQGDLTAKASVGTKIDELTLKIEPWTNIETVKSNLQWLRKQDEKTTQYQPSKLYIEGGYTMSDGTQIPFSTPWVKGSIDDAAKLISTRVSELTTIFNNMLKSGKRPGAPVDPSDPASLKYSIGLLDWGKEQPTAYSKRSIGALPFGDIEISGWDFKKLESTDKIDRRKWGYWLATLCTDEAFADLKKKLDSPKYIVTKSIPITNEDKIKLLDVIKQRSETRNKFVIDASSIKIKPSNAIESRTTTTIKGEDKVTKTIEKVNYSFPFSKEATQADAIAKTMFDNDSAIIKDNINVQLSQAIDEMLKAIGEIGELVSLEYRTIASTSDEPSAYIRPNKKGTTTSREANVPLAEDRAAAIENAFLALAKQKGIDQTKIKKGQGVLIPNNTMGGTAVYEKMKGMRAKLGGTPQQDTEYKAIFAEPKFSGIAFEAQVNRTNTTIEPTEEKVEDYSVKGNWGISINWHSKIKTGTTHPSRYIRPINFGKLFPAMGSGGSGPSVKELCAAYGG